MSDPWRAPPPTPPCCSTRSPATTRSTPAAPPRRPTASPQGSAAAWTGLRIGYVRHFHEADIPADPEVAAALDAAAATLEAAGATVRPVTLPPLTDFNTVNRVILAAESWSIHQRWLRERPGDYGQVTRRRLLSGAFLSAGDYVGAQRRRAQLIAATDAAFAQVDLLLTGSSFDPAAAIEDWPTVERTYSRQARMPFNVTGHPAISVLSGFSRGGLPLSAQLVGPAWSDAAVLGAADAFEQAAGFIDRRPPV